VLSDLNKLVALAERREPGFRRRLLVRAVLCSAAESFVLLNVMQGLAAQRAGEPTDATFVLFLAGLVLYVWGQRLVLIFAGDRYIELARATIEEIALRLHRLPLLEFEGLGRGMLMTRLLGDGNRLVAAGRTLVNVGTGAVRLALALLLIAFLSGGAMVIALVAAALVALVTLSQLRMMSEGFGEVAGGEAKLFDLLRDQHRGAIPLRLHGPRSRALARAYRELAGRLRALRITLWAGTFERQAASTALSYGALGVNVFLLPLMVAIDDESIRDINLALLWLLFSVIHLVFTLPQLSDAAKAAGRLQELRDRLEEGRLEPVRPPTDRGRFVAFTELAVDALHFHYPPTGARAGFAVGPVTARLRRGELVFVTGHNGSGKSTFLKLLTGLYAGDGGHIRVDGEAVGPADLADYRALFGTIFVDHTLFKRVYGIDAEGEARAAALLGELGIAGKTAIAGGQVTRRDLSTGQKKRLAMALTLLRDRPILVFDEWAADQDPGFREYYYHHLLPALRDAGKLVVVVTHDDQHFGLADRTLHFTDGRAIEREVSA
jgi:putative pyoverdin transport system ATP-binding/permease protein